jgi:UDP:flavonoid glycosyltransferase YjiC (YdhE family)
VTPELLRLTIKELLDNNSYREQVANYQKDMRKSGGYELTAISKKAHETTDLATSLKNGRFSIFEAFLQINY